MNAAPHPRDYQVDDRGDRVEVRGVTGRDVEAALTLLDEVREVQAEQVNGSRSGLVKALMAANISLTPPASLAQAHRLAARRDALLATPALSYADLCLLRGDAQESSTRTWYTRQRSRGAVFSVNHDGRTVIPAFQLDDDGHARPELRPLIGVLVRNGVDGWALWGWLTGPSSLLSGDVPEEVARTNPARAQRAAIRFAAAPAA